MELDLQTQIKNVEDSIHYLQYLISMTSCIHERFYYNELLSHYYMIYNQFVNIASHQGDEKGEEHEK